MIYLTGDTHGAIEIGKLSRANLAAERVEPGDGDYVIVRRQSSVDIGEIAVVLWEDKATVKRVVQTAPDLVLHPENSAMEDIVISAREFPEILGKVIGCVKKF